MPSLSELQASMARALLAADPAGRRLPAAWFGGNDHGERGLRTHRNNILGACANALRLSYPTVERLAGSDHFDALAADFVRAAPPTAPMLAVYGEGFAAFVAARAAAEDRALLEEVARFDWLFERVAQAPADDFSGARVALEGGVMLQLCGSLRLFDASFAVDELRAGTGSVAGTGHAPRPLALWRRQAGVAVQSLHAASATLLAALQAGAGLESALSAAVSVMDGDAAADELPRLVESDILRAGFARLSTH
jgi:hypothetical protein